MPVSCSALFLEVKFLYYPECDISATLSVMKIGGKSYHETGQCQTDIFTVTSPGNNAPPQICGTNTGEHSKRKSTLIIHTVHKHVNFSNSVR